MSLAADFGLYPVDPPGFQPLRKPGRIHVTRHYRAQRSLSLFFVWRTFDSYTLHFITPRNSTPYLMSTNNPRCQNKVSLTCCWVVMMRSSVLAIERPLNVAVPSVARLGYARFNLRAPSIARCNYAAILNWLHIHVFLHRLSIVTGPGRRTRPNDALSFSHTSLTHWYMS